MATLHIFNASHDEALAAHSPYYYPSTIARTLEGRWAALPAVWAEEGDFILLPKPTKGQTVSPKDCLPSDTSSLTFLYPHELTPARWRDISHIDPWGWDLLVRHKLHKLGAPEALLPPTERIDTLRTLSSRRTTTRLLPSLREALRQEGILTVGLSQIAQSEADIHDFLQTYPDCLGKSLWSCSGRGVFPLSLPLTDSTCGRIRRLLTEQGGIELEPRYEPCLDFALEFLVTRAESVQYMGLSVFSTNSSGGYTQNILEPQSQLRERLSRRWGLDALPQLVRVCEERLTALLADDYEGYLGIDMMLVTLPDDTTRLHPCIEVNLRRTMGIAALAAAKDSRRRDLFEQIMGKASDVQD